SVNVSDAAETHVLSAYAPTASVDVRIAQRHSEATVRAGSSLSLAEPDLNGRLVTQWTLSRGAAQKLVGKLAAGWTVETVETIPADAMGEWFIDRHGANRQLEIQLSQAANATRNVAVMVSGRLQRVSLAEPISADTLRMITW